SNFASIRRRYKSDIVTPMRDEPKSLLAKMKKNETFVSPLSLLRDEMSGSASVWVNDRGESAAAK
ncbi:MAG: hypothetical protein RID07_15730, partial [Lacipirellulaceae bacterium]